jgi:hypothetical protein
MMTGQQRPWIQRWFWLVYLGGIALLAMGVLFSQVVHAQTSCTVTSTTACLGASKTTGESPIATTLVWNVPGAASCTAGGAGSVSAWSGSIPCSGTRNLSGITTKMTLTISPIGPPTITKFQLKWTKPILNTDNTPLTNLGGYLIEYGTAAASLTQTLAIPLTSVQTLTPSATEPYDSTYTLDGLASGTWFAALKARTSGCFPATTVTCFESLSTNTVSRTVTTTPGAALPQLSVVIEPFQVPKPPTNLTAAEATAYEIRTDSTGKLLAQRIGVLRPGTLCAAEEQRVVDGITYSRVDRGSVDVVNFANGSDQWIAMVYARCS